MMPPDDERDDIRLGYQMAIQSWTYGGQLIWNVFSVMIVAHSVVLLVIAEAATNKLPLPGAVMAIVGFAICVAWLAITDRGFRYLYYYVEAARKLEKLLPTLFPRYKMARP